MQNVKKKKNYNNLKPEWHCNKGILWGSKANEQLTNAKNMLTDQYETLIQQQTHLINILYVLQSNVNNYE